MRILVIGGTGKFSSRISEAAAARGHELLIYNRGQRPLPPGVKAPILQGERDDLLAHEAEFAEFAPEAVIDSITFKPEQAQMLVDLFADVPRVVVISTVDVYGEDIGCAPVTEDRAPAPVSDYGKGKLACEKVLLDALGDRVTLFRPSHILGRGFNTTSLWSRSNFFCDRLLKGKLIPAVDGGRNLMTPVHGTDIAEWIMCSLETPEAGGEVFNGVGPDIITQKRYYELVAQALGVELNLVTVPSLVFKRVFSSPPQFNWHRPFSCAKAIRMLGYAPQFGPEATLRETVGYMQANGMIENCSADPFDDRLVELLVSQESTLEALLRSKAQ
jgi:nucleoside-diphosphate-sugar epimerase